MTQHLDNVKTWQQGYFISKRQYDHMPEQWKTDAQVSEAHLVRPSPEGNAICTCATPEIAAWLAERLNIASKLINNILVEVPNDNLVKLRDMSNEDIANITKAIWARKADCYHVMSGKWQSGIYTGPAPDQIYRVRKQY